jgi:hypothetical protein
MFVYTEYAKWDAKYDSKTVNEDCMIHIKMALELHMRAGKHLDLVLSSKPCGANVIGSNPVPQITQLPPTWH